TWWEEERVEIRGRDTDVAAPICLCAECCRQLRGPARSGSGFLAVALLAVSGLLAYFHLVSGVGLAVFGLALLVWWRRRVSRRRQRALKGLLRKVPAYRQILEQYPWAVVIMRNEQSAADRPAG